MHSDDLRRGALYMVGSALLFSLMGVGVKLAAQTMPNAMIVFFRSAVSLLVLLPLVAHLGFGHLRTGQVREHLVRGLAGLGAMYCFFHALANLRLADAILLNYSIPLFMPFVESLWLGEEFNHRLWGPIGLGFVGILLILKPGLGLFQPAALVGLAAALFASVAQVGIRRLTRTEPTLRIVFYFAVVSTVGSALPLLGSWRTPPSTFAWAALVAVGLLATVAQVLLTRAYARAPAARVGPFIYTSVVFAGLLDWMIWGRLPDRLAFVGTLLVGAAGIAALRVGSPAAEEPAVV